jgi:hypothetical protein
MISKKLQGHNVPLHDHDLYDVYTTIMQRTSIDTNNHYEGAKVKKC